MFTLAILIFTAALVTNNKSFSTLLLLTECIFFSLTLIALTLYGVTGLDYYLKTLASLLFLFSLELSIIIAILYSLRN